MKRWVAIIVILVGLLVCFDSLVSIAQNLRRKYRGPGRLMELVMDDPMVADDGTAWTFQARTKLRHWWGWPDTIVAKTDCPTVYFDPAIYGNNAEGYCLQNLGPADAYVWVNDAPDSVPWILKAGRCRIMDDRITTDSLRFDTPADTACLLLDWWWYVR